MGKQMDAGGAQPRQKDLVQILNQLLLSQRNADRAKSSRTASGIYTKRGAPAKRAES